MAVGLPKICGNFSFVFGDFCRVRQENLQIGFFGVRAQHNTRRRLGHNPAAALAASSDFKLVYSGFDAGKNTYTVSANYIIKNYKQAPWGTNFPLGGWEYTKKGPVCVEIHVWEYIRNDTSGKPQGYVRCDMWIKAPSPTGPYEIDVRTCMPNIWNAISAESEQHNAAQGRFASVVTIKNGATTVFNSGGPGDPNAMSVPNGIFNTSTNRLNIGTLSPVWRCVHFNGLPSSGISPNTIYWPAIPGYNTNIGQPYLAIDRAAVSSLEQNAPGNWTPNTRYPVNAVRKNGDIVYRVVTAGTSGANGGPTGTGSTIADGAVVWENITIQFMDQGSGKIAAFPVYVAFPSQGWHACDSNGDPIWVGPGTRPQIFPGHDFRYLTRRSKFVPPFNIHAGFQTTTLELPPFLPNMNVDGIQWAMAASGDGAADQRIGYISGFGVTSLMNPGDPWYLRMTIQGALSFSQLPLSYMNDEMSSMPFVGNNGTNNSGKPYANSAFSYPKLERQQYRRQNQPDRPIARRDLVCLVFGVKGSGRLRRAVLCVGAGRA